MLTATVQADSTQVIGPATRSGEQRGYLFQGGGSISALRAYRAYHPAARCHIVEYRGRRVWMTDKQFNIWHIFQSYHRRNRWFTLKTIADYAGCSKATVSRFLHRLDLWRFIDIAISRGRNGGVWVQARRHPFFDAEMWRAGAKVTKQSRKIAQSILFKMVKEWEAQKAAAKALRDAVNSGNTGATFAGKQTEFWGVSL